MIEYSTVIPEINKRIKQIIDFQSNGVVKKFAENIGIPQQTLNRLFVVDNRTSKYPIATTEILQKISEMYDIDSKWLLTGKGEMKKADEKAIYKVSENSDKGIPLIPIDAMAGFGSGGMQIMEYDCERYVIPMFRDAEFLISVKGSSMYPKYSSGDLVACKKVPLDTFFQWNKVYVLDTEQGALIKRVKKGSDKEHITLVSENKEYEPFELHLSSLYAIAVVVGVIRLE